MLLTRLPQEMVQFIAEVKNWEEAIRVASKPLLEKGSIEEQYIEVMINNVREFGPYIVLMPKVAMPHARPEFGVNEMGISLMITEKSVPFEAGDKSANIFFVLAANDSSSHLTLLQEISDFLSNEDRVNALLAAKSYEDLVNIF